MALSIFVTGKKIETIIIYRIAMIVLMRKT